MSQTHFLPVKRHALVERSEVIGEILRDDPALVVFRGAGGTGKSVTAAQLARAFVARHSPPGRSPRMPEGTAHAAWIRPEAPDTISDDVWRRILQTLLEAGLGGPDLSRLVEGGIHDSPGTVIAEALTQIPGRLLLVVDDAHSVLDERAQDILIDVLERLARVTVVLTTRGALPRLTSSRAHLRLPIREVEAGRLALTREEIAELLRLRGDVSDPARLAGAARAIHRSTHGWPLAAHALVIERGARPADEQDVRRPSAFIREFVDRLLAHGDSQTRAGLCSAAILGEVTSTVLAHMLGIDEASAQALLEAPEGDFGHWTDEAGVRWYHQHDLVANELRTRAPAVLGPARLQEVAARAAQVLRDDHPRAAMKAAVLGECWELLADLLADGATITIARDRSRSQLTEVPAEVRARYPVIDAFALLEEYAYPSNHVGRMLTGLRMLAGRSLAAESARPGLPGVTAATLRMLAARLSGGERLALAMADRVQEAWQGLSARESTRYARPLQRAMNQTAITLLHGERHLDALEVLEPMCDRRAELLPTAGAHAVSLAAWANAWRGDLPESDRWLRVAEEIDIPVGWHSCYIGTGYRLAAAIRDLERGDPVSAREHVQALSEHAPTIEHWPHLVVVGTLATELEHGPLAAAEYLDAEVAERRGRRTALATPARMLRALRARLLWQGGKVLPAPSRRTRGEMAGVYSALSRGEHETAAARAGGLVGSAHRAEQPRHAAELLLLRADLALRAGDDSAASAHARRAAMLLDRYGLSLPMRALPLDRARELARLCPTLPVAASASASVRHVLPLTGAERRALVEVVERGSVRRAAEALYLSPETVKGYLKHAYRKLGVRTRSEAVRVAADSGLLHDRLKESDG